MKENKFFIAENVIELIFGIGASIVIIGALMKITYFNLGFITADAMLTVGLMTEAAIFTIAGIRGYVLLKDNNVQTDATDVSDVSKEANELKLAYQNATTKLTSLGKNLSKVVDSTSAIDIPSDISSNMASLNENVSKTSKALDVLEKAYVNTEKAVATEPAAHKKVVENMNQLQSELSNLKKTVASLNAKYAEVLGAMKK